HLRATGRCAATDAGDALLYLSVDHATMHATDAHGRRDVGDDLHAAESLSAADAYGAPELGDGLHAILSDLPSRLLDPAGQLFPDNAAGSLQHSGQPELSAAAARHAGAAAGFRCGHAADAECRQSVRRRHGAADAERRASVRRPDRGDSVYAAAGMPSERERGLPDAERRASVRPEHAAAGVPSERERGLPDAERGASVRRPDRGDSVYAAAGMPSKRERDLPDAERRASGPPEHAAAGLPSERERDLPDAERGASVRRCPDASSWSNPG